MVVFGSTSNTSYPIASVLTYRTRMLLPAVTETPLREVPEQLELWKLPVDLVTPSEPSPK
jgi:hypothetical protein